MKVIIAILNWNGKDLLERFMPSVIAYADGHHVAVIDNNSSDNSAQFVQQRYLEVEWIQLDKNYGYAGGYNRGLANRTEDLVVLLNSDVEVSEGWLAPMINRFNQEVNLVAAQPKIRDAKAKSHFEYAGACGGLLDRYAYPYCRGRIFDTLEEDNGQYDDIMEVDWATGACLFFRLDAFQELGGLDEDLFAHMEEIDLCWRARRTGKRIECVPQSTVYHLGGATLSGYSPFKSYLNFKNSLIIFLKNDRSGKTYSRLFTRMLMDFLSILRFIIQWRGRHAWAVFKAHVHFYLSLPKTLDKRNALGKGIAALGDESIVWLYFGKGIKHYTQLDQCHENSTP